MRIGRHPKEALPRLNLIIPTFVILRDRSSVYSMTPFQAKISPSQSCTCYVAVLFMENFIVMSKISLPYPLLPLTK